MNQESIAEQDKPSTSSVPDSGNSSQTILNISGGGDFKGAKVGCTENIHHEHHHDHHHLHQTIVQSDHKQLEKEAKEKAKEEARQELDKLYASLKEELREKTGSIVQEPSKLPTEQKIDLVALEIESTFSKNEESQSKVALDTLFALSQEQAEKEARRLQPTQVAKHIEHHGNIVGVVGEAGIGKSSLCKMLASKIYDSNLLGIEFVFYILLRLVNFKKLMSLLEFLVTSSSCKWKKYRGRQEEILDKLEENSNVMIILDGFDEADSQTIEEPTKHVSVSSDYAMAFVKSILAGKLLPKSKKFVTSRRPQLLSLHSDCRPRFLASVMGLNYETQCEICRNICRKNYEKVMTYLDDNPQILSYCRIPIYCILTMTYIDQCINSENVKWNFQSITRVLIHAIGKFSKSEEHIRQSFQLEELAKLAWIGISKNQLVFTQQHLNDFNLQSETLDTFLDTSIASGTDMRNKIGPGEKTTSFPHKTIQEFLAAFYLVWFMSLDRFKMEMKQLKSDAFGVVTNFAFGLVNQLSIDMAIKEMNYTLSKDKVNIDDKINLLKKLASNALSEYFPNFSRKFLSKIIPRKSKAKVSVPFLRVCDWVYELQDDEFTKGLKFSLSEMSINIPDLQHSHTVSLPYLLERRSNNLHLKIECSYSSTKIIVPFFEMISKIASYQHIEIIEIDIMGNPHLHECFTSLCRCLQHIQRLRLVECKITGKHVMELSNAIQQLSTPMQSLNVGRNQLGDDGARAIVPILGKIEQLYLYYCNITGDGVDALATTIKDLTTKMKFLDLRYNKIGNDGAIAIASCLHNLEQVRIDDCGIGLKGRKALSTEANQLPNKENFHEIVLKEVENDKATELVSNLTNRKQIELSNKYISADIMKKLTDAINNLSSKLELLKLSCCYFDKSGFDKIISSLHKIRKLDLSECDINYGNVKIISEALMSTQMQSLDIHGNEISEEGIQELAKCSGNIEELHISNCGITARGVKVLATSIKKQMKFIDLSKNNIGDEGAIVLAPNLGNIEQLDLCECEITAKGAEVLANAVEKLQNPIKSLDLGWNKLGSEGAIKLSSCLLKIEKLKLYDCNLTADGVKAIALALMKLPNKIKLLNLGQNQICDEGASELASCINKIEKLGIRYCNITAVGVSMLVDGIKDFSTHLEYLDLRRNALHDEGAKSISSCLQNIQILDISQCRITSDGMKHLIVSNAKLSDEDNCFIRGLEKQF